MNRVSIDFFSKVSEGMKLSEIFLGEVVIPWSYSEVTYTADCTEGIGLSLFDKAVCGVLALDGAVSAERLGEILGLNVVSDIDNGKYADLAEQELLSKAISDLVSFQMVDRDPSNNLQLTALGKEYFSKGKKFRTTSNQRFSVFFDITGSNHAQAKKAFEYLHGMNVPGRPSSEFYDETLLKSFIHEQLPSIYDEENGNSFTNLSVSDVRNVTAPVHFAVIYDFQEKQYRFVGFVSDGDVQKEDAFFTDTANGSEEVRSRILHAFANTVDATSGDADEQIEEFEQLACEAQGMYDFNKYNNEDPSEFVENFASQRKVFEQERFWADLPSFINEDTKEVFFNFGMLDMAVLAKLDLLSKARPDLAIFVVYRDTDQTFDDHFGNVFFIRTGGAASGIFCCADSFMYKYMDYLAPGMSQNMMAVPVIFKDNDVSVDTSKLKDNFSKQFAPRLYQEAISFLDRQFEGTRKDIRSIEACDESVLVFKNGLTETEKEVLAAKKLSVFNKTKKDYETKLIERLAKVEEDASIDELKRLDIVEIWRGKINAVLSEADESYVNLQEAGTAVKARLAAREHFIREELLARTWVIDTNVFLDDPNILERIPRRDRVIMAAGVTDELDLKKVKEKGILSENAKTALRNINAMRKNHKKRFRTEAGKLDLLPDEFRKRSGDNFILAVAVAHHDDNPCLLTSDNGFQVKAQTCDIPAMSLKEFLAAADERDAKAREKQPEDNEIER